MISPSSFLRCRNQSNPKFPATPISSHADPFAGGHDLLWWWNLEELLRWWQSGYARPTGCFPLMVCETPPCLPFNTHFLATVRPTHAEERVQNGTEHLAGVGEAVYLFHTWTNLELIWWTVKKIHVCLFSSAGESVVQDVHSPHATWIYPRHHHTLMQRVDTVAVGVELNIRVDLRKEFCFGFVNLR